jgi:hypothetical protein
MTTNGRPLIMTWSKTAPKRIKRALSHHNDDDKISQIDGTWLTIKRRILADLTMNLWTRTALTNSRHVSGLGLRLTLRKHGMTGHSRKGLKGSSSRRIAATKWSKIAQTGVQQPKMRPNVTRTGSQEGDGPQPRG